MAFFPQFRRVNRLGENSSPSLIWSNEYNLSFNVNGSDVKWDVPSNVSFDTGAYSFEKPLTFRYYKSQFHAHTTNSDGVDSVSGLIGAYYGEGYEVLAITDHDHITSGSHEGMVILASAEETSITNNHIQAMGITSQAPPLVYGDPLTHTGQEIIDFHVINNPESPIMYNHPGRTNNEFTTSQLENDTYDLIEIINNRANGEYEAEWDVALTSGQRVYATANDDCHGTHLSNDFNGAWNMLYMSDLTQTSIFDCLMSGNFYCTSGGHDIEKMVVGDDLVVSSSSESNFTFIGENGTVLQTENNVLSSSYDISSYSQKYIRVVSRLSSNTGKVAFAQPMFFD